MRELWAIRHLDPAVAAAAATAGGPAGSRHRAARQRTAIPAAARQSATVAGHLNVTLLGRTFVILITAESPDGTMSARIANAVAEAYLADQIDYKNEANRRATEWLEQRLAELRRNLQVAEEAVATYRRDKGLAGSPEGAMSRRRPCQDLNGQIHRRPTGASRRRRVWWRSARPASIPARSPTSPRWRATRPSRRCASRTST